jgi:lipoprotein LpqH
MWGAHHTAFDGSSMLMDRKTAMEAFVKRGFMAAVAVPAIVVAGLAGCTSKNSSAPGSSPSATSSPTTSTTTSTTASPGASPAPGSVSTGAGPLKVTVDGKDQNANGDITCTTQGGTTTIVIQGNGGQYSAQVNDGTPPTVTSVSIQNSSYNLAYKQGTAGNADATKDGNSYKVTGTAMGTDLSNPAAGVANKPFEIDVTCP